jgi:hypothetical protein
MEVAIFRMQFLIYFFSITDYALIILIYAGILIEVRSWQVCNLTRPASKTESLEFNCKLFVPFGKMMVQCVFYLFITCECRL